ncbi:hypothetical protein [Pseudomonas matsuisoli]|uniref:UrcA family protein n=1 Tax=Pseudomonas matsuisoli TaxID=1515666 RepID=A0A917UX95_9PSED|nr:hypothetical protein [Pseudomonas matsuisoli]GGJ92602.1 hypothetical protein GCM10009304_18040 [Pseudomonas matsuisoli]
MRRFLIISICLLLSSPSYAEDTALAQAAKTIQPAVQAAANYTQKSILQTMASGDGALADGAKRAMATLEHQERMKNRGPRQTMQECIKPNSVIDDDVKECMEGLRPRTW